MDVDGSGNAVVLDALNQQLDEFVPLPRSHRFPKVVESLQRVFDVRPFGQFAFENSELFVDFQESTLTDSDAGLDIRDQFQWRVRDRQVLELPVIRSQEFSGGLSLSFQFVDFDLNGTV